MTSHDAQVQRALMAGYWPTLRSAFPDIIRRQKNPLFGIAVDTVSRSILRPSAVLGPNYGCASQIYFRGVHDILAGKASAAKQARILESQLDSLLHSGNDLQQGCP